MPNLPFELIEDILRRLPVKSLKRFRAVAKTWCALIDSEAFVKSHLRRSLASKSHRRIILGGLGLYSIDLDKLDKADVIKPPFYYKSVDGVSNSVNGVVLVMSEPPVLWNPFSRDYKVLPEASAADPPEDLGLDSYSKTSYGFGYDEENNDYKVVRIVEFRTKNSHIWLSSECRIYSWNLNSWKKVPDFPYPLPFLRGNWRVHVNGAMHTLVWDPEGPHGAKIMAFSLLNEKHSELAMPPGVGVRSRGSDATLDIVGGCLALIYANGPRSVVWVMKDYGVKESWIKLLSISPPAIEKGDFVKPLDFLRDGSKVLLNVDDKKLVSYDLRSKTVEDVPVEGMPFVFYAEVCVESLIGFDPIDNKGSPTVEVKKKSVQVKKKEKSIRNKRDDFLSEGFKLVL